MINIPVGNKGEMVLAAFDLGQLLSSSAVTDPYFQNPINIKEVVVYLSSLEEQPAVIRFTVPDGYVSGNINAFFMTSSNSRNEFGLTNVTLVDHQGGTLTCTAPILELAIPGVTQEFSISYTTSAPDIDVLLNPIDGDGTAYSNFGNMIVSGSVSHMPKDSVVTVLFNSQEYQDTVQPNLTFSVEIDSSALSGLSDGSYVVGCDVRNDDDEIFSASSNVNILTLTVNLSIDGSVDSSLRLSSDKQQNGFSILGNTGLSITGQSVQVDFLGHSFSSTANSSGEFAVSIPAVASSSITPGSFVPFEVFVLVDGSQFYTDSSYSFYAYSFVNPAISTVSYSMVGPQYIEVTGYVTGSLAQDLVNVRVYDQYGVEVLAEANTYTTDVATPEFKADVDISSLAQGTAYNVVAVHVYSGAVSGSYTGNYVPVDPDVDLSPLMDSTGMTGQAITGYDGSTVYTKGATFEGQPNMGMMVISGAGGVTSRSLTGGQYGVSIVGSTSDSVLSTIAAKDVCYHSGNSFIAVGANGVARTTTNVSAWSSVTFGSTSSVALRSVASNGSVVIAVGTQKAGAASTIFRSTSGGSGLTAISGSSEYRFSSVAYNVNGGYFLACGTLRDDTTAPVVAVSSGLATTWDYFSQLELPGLQKGTVVCSTESPQEFLMVGKNISQLLNPYEGKVVNGDIAGLGNISWVGVTRTSYGNFLAVGNDVDNGSSKVAFSHNGVYWNSVDVTSVYSNHVLSDVICNADGEIWFISRTAGPKLTYAVMT